MPDEYLEKIRSSKVYDVAIRSPLDAAPILSARLQNQVYLKREDLQPVHSFKLRGAYNKIAQLPPEQRAKGVICASAGNHAQGVAMAASKLGIQATIVMPETTPPIKVDAVRRYGGNAVLHGDAYDDASEHAYQLAAELGLTFVHPYDDPDTIAGQGSIAMELLEQLPEIDVVFVPVGGGGLIAGVAAYIKAVKPSVKVVAVESVESPTLHAAMAAKARVILPEVGLFADGVAVKQIGEETFRLAQSRVDECLLVTVDEMCAAIRDSFEETRSILEPAGALALAGLKKYVDQHGVTGLNLVAIQSGANVNFDRLRHIAERAEVGEQREALFAVSIPEQPGSFKAFCKTLGKRGITEFNYRFAENATAHIFVGIALSEGQTERQALADMLRSQGYPVVDLTDDEMAKLHIRYMVGGRAEAVGRELLFRVRFPERPGALLQFLQNIGKRWNISLFHYRNHGSAYGRVLVGLQVQAQDDAALLSELDALGYPYSTEFDNPAYQLFLSGVSQRS